MKKSLFGLAAFMAVVVIAVVFTTGLSGSSEPDGGESAKALHGQGIQVHGHWTFDVTNPDGSHAWSYEFENALVGGNTLANILGRSLTPGLWSINLDSASLNDPTPCGTGVRTFPTATFGPLNCGIVETIAAGIEGTAVFKNLTLSRSENSDGSEIVLTGSMTASFDGSLEIARTRLTLCEPDVPTTDCGSSRPGVATAVETITETRFNRIELVDGQTMLVTVRISFS